MTDDLLDETLRAFRADQRGPRPDAAADIARRARGRRLRLPALGRFGVAASTLGLAAAALVAFAVMTDLPGSPPQDAVAAVRTALAPTNGILHNVYTVRYEQRPPGSDTWQTTDTIRLHEILGYEGDKLTALRLFISAYGLDRAPTDEDSVITLGADGHALAHSYSPGGGVHEEALPEASSLDEVSTAGRLRAWLASGQVDEVSHTDDTITLSGPATTDDPCGEPGYGPIVVDRHTFLPISMIEGFGCDHDFATRQVISVESSERLDGTPENRKLLEMGDWK